MTAYSVLKAASDGNSASWALIGTNNISDNAITNSKIGDD